MKQVESVARSLNYNQLIFTLTISTTGLSQSVSCCCQLLSRKSPDRFRAQHNRFPTLMTRAVTVQPMSSHTRVGDATSLGSASGIITKQKAVYCCASRRRKCGASQKKNRSMWSLALDTTTCCTNIRMQRVVFLLSDLCFTNRFSVKGWDTFP